MTDRATKIGRSHSSTVRRMPITTHPPGDLAHQGDASGRDWVDAPDAETAIKEAIERYGIINREQQKQLAARRVK